MPSRDTSRRNLALAIKHGQLQRLRSDRETVIIKLLIWQQYSIQIAVRRSTLLLASLM
jgi:hypothetical protein